VNTILHQIVQTSPELAKLTRAMYLRDLDAWITFAGADPAGWTRYKAQEFYGSLLERMQPQSANRLMASLKYASSWLAKKENDPALDFAVVQMADGKSKADRRALDQEDALKLLATCATDSPIDLRDRALIVMGLETGMRRMSLIGVRIDTIKMGRDGYPVAPVPIKGGGDELFSVPLSDAVMIAIEPWRQWLRNRKVTKGPLFRSLARKMDGRGKLMYTVGENQLSESAIYKIVTQRAKTAGLEHVHPHIFRHTFITWRMQGGMQPYQVAAITGHKIANITGMGALGGYVDVSRVGQEARQATPPWLSKLIGRRS
jgi:integrase/recombinase XerD